MAQQLNVLHQAASCSSCYNIRDIARHVHTCNGLLIRLLKTVRQPTTGFALLGAHQVGAVPEFPSTACSTSTQIGLFFENYTHLQINLVFARDSPETQLNLSLVGETTPVQRGHPQYSSVGYGDTQAAPPWIS
ncbi:hypothetical protein CSKR_111043 [Clonorchis sinensis]|uniref:Uncharacterized protein n=1 Tax=Clonorchis sinensis TaxID=79923 RepID=A0A419QE07_CLOSI|nr:hypothetical protein CSKR_111043 [Clonorchis sinensis]